MSSSPTLQNTDETRTAGITVEKGIEPGEQKTTVRYRITSDRPDAAAVRIVESLPSGYPTDKLGFDSALTHGDWLVDGGDIALVDILQPGERLTTGYVVEGNDPDAIDPLAVAPTIETVDPMGEAPVDTGDPAETSAGGVEEASGAAVERAVDESLSDAVEERPTGGERPDDEDETGGDPETTAVTPATLVTALAEGVETGAIGEDDVARLRSALLPERRSFPERLRDGDVGEAELTAVREAVVPDRPTLAERAAAGDLSDEERETLREELLPEERRSDEVRMRELRSRLEEFAAYADALEELIDEHGTAEEIIGQFREDIDALRADVEDIDQRVAAGVGEADSLSARLDGFGDRLDRVDDRFETVERRLDDLAALEARVDDQAATVEGLSETVADAAGPHDSPAERFDAVEGRLDTAGDRMDAVDRRLDGTDRVLERLDDGLDRVGGRVDAVDGRLEGVDDDLAELSTRAEDADERLANLEGRIDDELATLSAEVAALDEVTDDLVATIETVQNRVDEDLSDLEAELDCMDDRIGSLADAVETARDRFEGRLDDLAADLEETTAWREQLGAAFQDPAAVADPAANGASGGSDRADDDETTGE